MYIIQISDFHINKDTDTQLAFKKIDALFDSISNKLENKPVLLCICGDIFDHGKTCGLANAKIIFDYLEEKFKGFNSSLEFVPGNHDLINDSFTTFDEFIGNYLYSCKYSFDNNSIILKEYEELILILANSTYHKNHEFGNLDIIGLKEKIQSIKKKVVLVTHHTFLSRYNEDKSPIRNSYDLLNLLGNYNIKTVLHGHTHGLSEIKVGNNCEIVGIGPFLKQVPDVNSQFNLIEIISGEIIKINNYRYFGDTNSFSIEYPTKDRNIGLISGNKLDSVYEEATSKTKYLGQINNFNLRLKLTIDEFNKSVETYFKDIIPIAEQWLSKEVPSSLYYNHGKYIYKGNNDGLKYVVDELLNKSTSNRAIIPLVNVEDVVQSKDNFLPSLDIIQFGFDSEAKDELLVTVYMRALEVNYFLKINISEIYLLAKELKKRISSISNININIIAFRAQFKEFFGCFQKALIDSIDITELSFTVAEKNIPKIIYLLENKMSLSETVVIDTGVTNLCKCLKDYNKHKEGAYPNELIKNSDILLSKYLELKELRTQTSLLTKIESNEKEVVKQLQKVIGMFKEMK